jgi:hypothetical protein
MRAQPLDSDAESCGHVDSRHFRWPVSGGYNISIPKRGQPLQQRPEQDQGINFIGCQVDEDDGAYSESRASRTAAHAATTR